MLDALAKAQLDRFVQGLPAGIHTRVHETGRTVSSGGARRIALAQLFLRNTAIILLNEPTVVLDADTEQAVLQALRQHWQHKTVLLITHQATPPIHFDQHYRLENGSLRLVS